MTSQLDPPLFRRTSATADVTPTKAPRLQRRGPFRGDIEGLRGFALLLVLAFHASVPGFVGGFVGLDVFFVISGYLITGQLLAELKRSGRLSLGAFYARRARRLIPAASVVLIATALAAYFTMPILRTYRLTIDLLSSALYYANWHFIAQGNNYLALTQGESPAQHFWSLSLEEQFYVLWPVLIIACVWAASQWRIKTVAVYVVVLGGVTALSFDISMHLATSNPGLAYMGTQSRAWQFGVGGLLALATASLPEGGVVRKGWTHVVGVAGLAALVTAIVMFNRSTPYPGIHALPSTLGGVALVLAGPYSVTGRLMSWKPLRLIGRWSYGWYLWHWPLLILVEEKYGPQNWHVQVGLMAIAGVLAWLTYLVVERPIHTSTTLMTRMPAAGALAVTAMVASMSVVLGVGSATAKNLGATNANANPAAFAQAFGEASDRDSGPVFPSPLNATADLPVPSDCIVDHTSVQKKCVFGHVGGRSVVLIGDSHAHQWQPAFQAIADKLGWQLTVIAKAGCPIADIPVRAGDTSRLSDPTCPLWRAQQIAAVVAMRPSLIITTNLRNYIPDDSEIAAAWKTTLDAFRQSGARIAYLRDTPKAPFDVPECVADSLDDWSRCAFPAPTVPEPVVLGIEAGRIKDVRLLDLNGYLCDGNTCPAVRNGTLMYRDDAHLTATAVKLLEPAVLLALKQAGLV